MNVVILDGFSVTQNDLDWAPLNPHPSTLNPHPSTLTPHPSDLNPHPSFLTVYDRTRPQDTVERCREAEAVLTNKVVLSAEVIAALPRLRYIGVLATGYNVVDCEAARQRGIVVTNIPAYSTASVAQLVFAHLLNVTNSVAHYAAARDRWPLSPDFLWMDTPLTELAGKTFGIYGLGNIGLQVAKIALAFGMNVLAVTSKSEEALPPGVVKAEWEELLARADVLSLHCPLTPATRAMMNKNTLARMKPSAILINTGRGPLVDEQAVADALAANRLAAYCADVLSTEPPSPSNPLLTAPRCYLTPHIAWATHEVRTRLIQIATANLQAFINGQPINVVS
ncbi:MAG: D-2-hydroxyacid dehydrogenase [Bacteroidaceae bacterium]|nr:D-2-hydroxyacid dehydrogenase [Bacteroidaceae bacterium]